MSTLSIHSAAQNSEFHLDRSLSLIELNPLGLLTEQLSLLRALVEENPAIVNAEDVVRSPCLSPPCTYDAEQYVGWANSFALGCVVRSVGHCQPSPYSWRRG
jgi:hypothetical protein